MKKITMTALAGLLAATSALGLAGCSANGGTNPTPTPTVAAPIVIDLAKFDGKPITIKATDAIVFEDKGKAATDVTAEVSDPEVIQYVERYSADGGKTFAPGLLPIKLGKSDVTVSSKGHPKAETLKITVDFVDPGTK